MAPTDPLAAVPEREPETTFSFGRFVVEPATRQLLRDGEPVPLTAKVFDTLVALITHRDRTVGKDELMSIVWPDSFVSEDSLTQNISAIRRALGDDPLQPKFVATIARKGYRFIAPIDRAGRAGRAGGPGGAGKTGEAGAPDLISATTPTSSPAPPAPPAQPALPAQPAQPALPVRPALPALPALVIAVLALAIGAGLTWWLTRRAAAPSVPSVRTTLEIPDGTTLSSGGMLSPNGRFITFVALDREAGEPYLWLRNVESGEVRRLAGTEGAARPFWAPDSQAIGFSAGSRIKRVGVAGDPVRALVPTISTRPNGGTWGADGRILYSDSGVLYSVSAAGGAATRVRAPDPMAEELSLTWPHFLPDGRRFLYLVNSVNADRAGTYVGAIDSAEKVRVLGESGQPVIYAPPGYLLYVREGALLAHPFDAGGARTTGEPVTIAGNVLRNGSVSASAAGLLTFGGGPAVEQLVWFDRSGQKLGTVNAPVPLRDLSLSPDGRQLLANNLDPPTAGAWLVDLDRGVPSRIVPAARMPYWSPDGSEIAFTSERLSSGVRGIYVRPAMGRGEDQLLLQTDESKFMNDWSPDGRYLVFVSWNPRTRQDLWLLPRDGDRKPVPFVQTEANEVQGQVSPDGRWLAYASDESGQLEVYVQSFPAPGVKLTISSGGGAQPHWRGDGRELFYLAENNELMSVDVAPGNPLRFGAPRPLFRTTVLSSLLDARNHYTATRDGQRFLILSVDPGERNEPITMLVNWTARLAP